MILGITLGIVTIVALAGFRVVNQTERGVVETFGKYSRYAEAGLTYTIPLVQRIKKINITERMASIDKQEIITEDKLNAMVDLVVFYKVRADEINIKKALYNVNDFADQIITLAQTTARNVIGDMMFKDVNSKRNQLNVRLADIMKKETANWGVEIVRVELREITPPQEVQATMNEVIQAENKKRAAIDFATAKETEADGIKRAKIKEAEGDRQSQILKAEGASKAFKMINASFKGNAQKLKQFEVTQNSLQSNSKIVLGESGKGILKLFDINK